MKRKSQTKRPLFTDFRADGKMGFLHFLAMFGATILVPLLANLSISVALLSAGLGTLLFILLTRKKVPVFLGSSFAFLPGLMAIMTMDGIEEVGSNSWQFAMGGLVVAIWLAGLLYIVFASLLRVIGLKKLRAIFPAYVVGPVIIVIGLILVPKVVYNDIIAQYWDYHSVPWKEWTIAIVTMLGIIFVASLAKPKKFLSFMPVLSGFGIGYLTALIIDAVEMIFISHDISQTMILVEFSRQSSINWGQVAIFQDMESYFGFWRYLHFDLNAIALICPIGLVAMIEHINNIDEISHTSEHDFLLDPGVDQTIVSQGIGTMLSGLLGGLPITAYSENASLMADRKDFRVNPLVYAAIIAMIVGIFSPFANLFYTIPKAVIGGTAVVIFGMIAVRGAKMMFYGREELHQPRNVAIAAAILTIGLGFGTLSFVSDITGDLSFKLLLGGVDISSLFIATFVGITLNLVLPRKKVQKEVPVAPAEPNQTN